MKRKNIAWIGLTIALMLVLIGAGCQRRALDNEITNNTIDNSAIDNSVDNTIDNSLTPPNNVVPDSGLPKNTDLLLTDLKKEFVDATAAIKSLIICGQTKDDLVLTIVSSKFINTLSDDGLDTNWFIYTSPSDPANYYLVNMPRKGLKFKRIIMPVTDFDFLFEVLPIPDGKDGRPNLWNKSYIDALYKSEALGGALFRAAHKTYEVSTILAYPASGSPQQLTWSVTYKSTGISPEATFKVQVNATTGEGMVIS